MLTNNPTQMDSYNKHSKAGQGTFSSIQAPSWPIGLKRESIGKPRATGGQPHAPISPRSTKTCSIAKVSRAEMWETIQNLEL